MPTPARLAMSSSGASAPRSANAAVAAAISRAWFCRASARNCSAGRGGTWSDVLVITLRLTRFGSTCPRCGRDRITRQHGGILSSSHAPHGADDARGGGVVNGDRARHGPPGSPRRGSGRPGIALAIMLSAQLMIILDMTVVNIALPHIQADLHYSATSLSWVLNGYTLTSGGLLLLGGRA